MLKAHRCIIIYSPLIQNFVEFQVEGDKDRATVVSE